MLGVTDPADVLNLIDIIEQIGVDAMSAGVCAAWATEAMNHGLINEIMTGGIRLSFGVAGKYLPFLRPYRDKGLILSEPWERSFLCSINLWW